MSMLWRSRSVLWKSHPSSHMAPPHCMLVCCVAMEHPWGDIPHPYLYATWLFAPLPRCYPAHTMAYLVSKAPTSAGCSRKREKFLWRRPEMTFWQVL